MTIALRVSLVAFLASFVGVASARAQDDAVDTSEDTASDATEDSAPDSPTTDEEVAGEEYEPPSVLLVAQREAADALVEDVRSLLAQGAVLVDGGDYEREARNRGLSPGSAEAMSAILDELMPELDLVVVVAPDRPSRATTASVRYLDRFGLEILEEAHPIRGNLLTDEARIRVLAELRLALAVITRPRGGLGELGGGVAPGEAQASLAVHVGAAVGVGFGTRELSFATRAGILGLDVAIFPAAAVELSIDVEPTAQGQLTLGGDVSYLTSLGLVTTDQRIDGTTRDTDARSQRIAGGLRIAYRVQSALNTVSLGVGLAWSALSFTSEAPVSLPDFTLQGPTLAPFVVLPLLDGLFAFTLAPELQWIVDVGGGLSQLGIASSGVAVGGAARLRVRILDELFADLTYRESHAFLSSEPGGGSDGERFVTIRAVYRP